MDFLQLLNNGYDPRLIIGYGGLGYRPQLHKYGEGGLGYNPKLHMYGEGLTQLVKFTPGTTRGDPIDYQLDLYEGSDGKENLKATITDESYKNDPDTTLELIDYYTKKEDIDKQDKKNLLDAKMAIALNTINKTKIKPKIDLNKKLWSNVMENANKLMVKSNVERQKLTKAIPLGLPEAIHITPKDKTEGLRGKLDKVVKYENKYSLKPTQHYKSQFKTTLVEAIKYALKVQNISKANELVAKLNNLPIRNNYKIENNKLTIMEKELAPKYEYEKNLEPSVAHTQIKKYWEDNEETVLETDEDLPSHINSMIEEIIEVYDDMFDESMKTLKPEAMKKIYEPENNFYNFQIAKKFMESIVVNGKKYFYKTVNGKEVFDEEKAEKEFYSSGKPGEFSICGVGNPNANLFYGLKKPNIQITDYIIENLIGGGIGKQFPIDNIDLVNKIFNEMKSYNKLSKLNYARCYNINIELKKMYYNDLKKTFTDIIDDYILAILKGNKKQMKLLEQDIKIYYEVLTNKKKFDLDFYKNRKYCGVGITMNKFNPVKIPEGYDFEDSPSTKAQIEKVASRQGQKFIPEMENRYVVGMTKKSGEGKKSFDDGFRQIIKNDKYKYFFTCVTPDGVCVYNYTDDEDVLNDFILGTYKTGYASDDREGNYNGVIIPIEKFVFVTPKPK